MDALLSSKILIPLAILLLASVVFLGGVIFQVVSAIRADRRHEKFTDRMWNLHANLMEELGAIANLDAYAYRQAMKRKTEQRASAKPQKEHQGRDPNEIGAS